MRRPEAHLVASLIVLDHPGQLCEPGPLQLRRSQDAAGFGRERHRIYRDGPAFPGQLDCSGVPLRPVATRLADTASPCRPGADGTAGEPGARASRWSGASPGRLGDSLEQTKATWQAGLVGDEPRRALPSRSAGHDGDLNQADRRCPPLAGALGDVRDQVKQSMGNVHALVNALTSMQNQIGGGKTLKDIDNAAKLVTSMRAMGGSLTDIIGAARAAGPVMPALDASPMCNMDPSCVRSRDQLRRLVAANDDGTLNQMSDLARQLQSTTDTQSLQSTVDGLRRALDSANGATRSLSSLQDGADQLADGSHQLADGVQLLVDQTKKMGAGLGQASEFLLGMQHGAGTPSMSGFYIPPQMLKANEFKTVADIFMSPDGHATRFLIQTKLNPFSTAAMDQMNSITNAARSAQPNTALADAKVSMTGMTVGLRDTRDYYNQDTKFIVVATIIIVLLILMALLRAIVAPLYLILSVLISYASALGIGVIVFQFLLGQELHWSAPGLTFILLVAVGADYNLLLISRIREESAHGVRSGVIRTVGSTGAVITSAGLIFAASMFGLTFASITTLVQIGFIIGSRDPARYVFGAHHHGARRGRAGWPSKLVAVTAHIAE